jgi:amino acid adenylation domain-containing protein
MHSNHSHGAQTDGCYHGVPSQYHDIHHDCDCTGLELTYSTLPGLVQNRAEFTPEATAIDSYQGRLSYARLRDAVDTLALSLSKNGVRFATRVGLYCEISLDAIVHILAVMSLGAIAVPVDPHHPAARRLAMLREASVALVIGDCSDNGLEWAATEFPTIDLASTDMNKEISCQLRCPNEATPGADAFVGFTSGSTGRPKGIVQSHEGIVTMSKALALKLSVNERSRVAQIAPYIFDVAMMEMAMSFIAGAALCIMRKQVLIMPEPGELASYLNSSAITHITLSPTMLKTMDPETVPGIQVLSVMGESLSRSAVQSWASTPERRFYQLWGCTEATILQSITTTITKDHSPRDIGFALDRACRLWVVDPANVDRLVGDGEPGELVVESRALARGYIGRPEETDKVFLSHAAWQDDTSLGKIYRTGDMVQKQADGSIEFLGRNDGQMNRYGERVELGEIDFHIDQVRPPHIADCFVDFHAESRTIVGFVCGSKQNHTRDTLLLPWDQSMVDKKMMSEASESLLKQGELSDYMVPQTWLPITSRPLTASNKTDRLVLRQMMEALSEAQWKEYCVSKHE